MNVNLWTRVSGATNVVIEAKVDDTEWVPLHPSNEWTRGVWFLLTSCPGATVTSSSYPPSNPSRPRIIEYRVAPICPTCGTPRDSAHAPDCRWGLRVPS